MCVCVLSFFRSPGHTTPPPAPPPRGRSTRPDAIHASSPAGERRVGTPRSHPAPGRDPACCSDAAGRLRLPVPHRPARRPLLLPHPHRRCHPPLPPQPLSRQPRRYGIRRLMGGAARVAARQSLSSSSPVLGAPTCLEAQIMKSNPHAVIRNMPQTHHSGDAARRRGGPSRLQRRCGGARPAAAGSLSAVAQRLCRFDVMPEPQLGVRGCSGV